MHNTIYNWGQVFKNPLTSLWAVGSLGPQKEIADSMRGWISYENRVSVSGQRCCSSALLGWQRQIFQTCAVVFGSILDDLCIIWPDWISSSLSIWEIHASFVKCGIVESDWSILISNEIKCFSCYIQIPSTEAAHEWISMFFVQGIIFILVSVYDSNHGNHSPSPLRSRHLGLSFVSVLLSLLLLWHGEFSSVSSSLWSRSNSDIGDVAGESSSWLPSTPLLPEWFPALSLWFFSPLRAPSPASCEEASSPPSLTAVPASAPGSAWFLGLEGLEGLQLPRESSNELGLECREREGVSGSLMVVQGAPYGSWTNPTNFTPWSAASWICCWEEGQQNKKQNLEWQNKMQFAFSDWDWIGA